MVGNKIKINAEYWLHFFLFFDTDLKYGTQKLKCGASMCSHKGCTFDHLKLKGGDECQHKTLPATNKTLQTDHAQDDDDNEVSSVQDKEVEEWKRSDSGLEKSIDDSLKTTATTTSGFLEIDYSQKDGSKADKLDISYNSTNNGDDEDENDEIPSLAMDSEEDDADWDKCSSTKDVSSSMKKSCDSMDLGDGFELIKSPADLDEVLSVEVVDASAEKQSEENAEGIKNSNQCA